MQRVVKNVILKLRIGGRSLINTGSKSVCFIYGRDEEQNLTLIVSSLLNQTHPLDKIFYVDDASIDGSVKIIENFNLEIIRLKKRHPSWLTTPKLSTVVNKGIEVVYGIPEVKYLLILPSDVVLSENYVEILFEEMEQDANLMICGGIIDGEYTSELIPRGAGRLIRFNFWKKYVKYFPFCYSWESYPLYKALALGYKTKTVKKAIMYNLRPTKKYQPLYGYAMTELGFLPLYALSYCLLTFLSNRERGIRMLKTYLFNPLTIIDNDVKNWMRNYQITQIVNVLKNPIPTLQQIMHKLKMTW